MMWPQRILSSALSRRAKLVFESPARIRCFYISTPSDTSSFDSGETGARAGVRALSQEIHRCAEAKEYSISWNYPGNEQERGWRALKYIRKDQVSGIIGYEYDPSSGTREPTYLVDDKAVHEVAKEGGTLNDFAKYQKKQSDTHQGFKALGQTGAFASMGSMSIPRRAKEAARDVTKSSISAGR